MIYRRYKVKNTTTWREFIVLEEMISMYKTFKNIEVLEELKEVNIKDYWYASQTQKNTNTLDSKTVSQITKLTETPTKEIKTKEVVKKTTTKKTSTKTSKKK